MHQVLRFVVAYKFIAKIIKVIFGTLVITSILLLVFYLVGGVWERSAGDVEGGTFECVSLENDQNLAACVSVQIFLGFTASVMFFSATLIVGFLIYFICIAIGALACCLYKTYKETEREVFTKQQDEEMAML